MRDGAVSSRRCASRPTKIVPSSPTDTTDGTSASPDASRITVRHAVLHVGDEAVRGPEIDADDFTHGSFRLRLRLAPSKSSGRRDLAFDGRQQVVDVVALEQPLAQRVERRAPVSAPRRRCWRPSCALSSCELRARAPRACARSAARAASSRARSAAGRRPTRAARESRPAPRSARTLPRAAPAAPSPCRSSDFGGRQPFDRQQMLDARNRVAQRAIGVVQIRRPLQAGQPLGRATRCRSSPDETCGSARGSAARGPARSIVSCRGRPRNAK